MSLRDGARIRGDPHDALGVRLSFLLILGGGSMSFYYPWKMAGLFCLKVGPLFSLKGMGLSFEGFNEGVNGKSPI